tara:strand:+ start:563 stop:1123 length:561 start_codon:yes stop_codon:yes gene_type:complete
MAMTLILSQTADSDTNMDFVEGTNDVVFDSTYKLYIFKCIACQPEAGDGALFGFEASTDTGTSYGVTCTNSVFQADQQEDATGASLLYSTSNDLAQSVDRLTLGHAGTEADENISGTIWLFNPSSTTYVKHYHTDMQAVQDSATSGGLCRHSFNGGYWNTTSAVDAFRFKFDSSDWTGTVKLYGVG